MDAAASAQSALHPRTDGLLTPIDVRHKTFTTVRLREGYDPTEVDLFLGQVELTITKLSEEISDLSSRLDRVAATDASLPSPAEIGEKAARVVALAQDTSDRVIAEARSEAAEIIEDARGRAADVDQKASENAAALEREINEHRAAMNGLHQARKTEEEEIKQMQDIASAYRRQLNELAGPIGELRDMLDRLEGHRDDQKEEGRSLVPSQPTP